MKLVEAWDIEVIEVEVPLRWDVGTVPDGITANTYGLMKADENLDGVNESVEDAIPSSSGGAGQSM